MRNMPKIHYIERSTGEERVEKVYGAKALEFMYGEGWTPRILSKVLLPCLAKSSFFSSLYGILQKSPFSRKKVRPFIESYHIDEAEFADPVDSFRSFNDFFIRKLNPSSRPIDSRPNQAVLPADGRYLVYPNVDEAQGFFVKGQKFCLSTFLQNPVLARRFAGGSMVIARLCPTDYHRFHFPCEAIADRPKLINGFLFSVNPIALRKNLSILWENKRFVTEMDTTYFGTVLYVEVGATAVGSVKQTFSFGKKVEKGEEKGYFSFGGSCVILLFEKNRIQFDADLIANSEKLLETRALFGQSLGKAIHSKMPSFL